MAKHPIQSSQKLNAVIQQAANSRMWMVAFFTLAAIFLIAIKHHFTVIKQNNQTLIPYGLATLEKSVEYSSSFDSQEEYLSLIAQADVHLWGDWRPMNIQQKYKRFLKRTTNDLAAAIKPRLDASAIQNKKNEVSQNVLINGKIRMRMSDSTIVIPVLIESRILGEPGPVKRKNISIKYINESGLPVISSFNIDDGGEEEG